MLPNHEVGGGVGRRDTRLRQMCTCTFSSKFPGFQFQNGVSDYVTQEERFHGTKPWFVRKLPSRIELLEGSAFDMFCRVGRHGCRPWFIRELPNKIEVPFGAEVQTSCLVTSSEVNDDVTTMTSSAVSKFESAPIEKPKQTTSSSNVKTVKRRKNINGGVYSCLL